MRKFLVTTAAGLALAAGSIAVATLSPIGAAFAQDGSTPAATAPAAPADGQAGTSGHEHRHLRRAILRGAVKDAAGVIGIDVKDLATARRDGQSIAQVATAHGVDPQTVIDKLVADGTTRLDAAVTAGQITPERAATAKSHLSERATRFVNHQSDGSHHQAAGAAK